jgi:type II secretory pathway pseudopilin PulG
MGAADEEAVTAKGFTLVELLIATALVLAISGALAAALAPLGSAIDRTHANADMDAGTRSVIQQLAADLRLAGSNASIGWPYTRLARVLPPVALLRDLETGAIALPATAIRITYVPHLAAQGMLNAAVAAGDTMVSLDTASRCAAGLPACGFRPGDSAVLYTSGAVATVTIDAVANGAVMLSSPLAAAFPADAVLAQFSRVTYGTRPVADGSQQLVRVSTGGAEQPMLDNVVAFTLLSDTGHPLDAGRVSWTLRVQAPLPAFRGPAGWLFRRPGTATRSRDWVPDIEHRMVVALRNREASW